MLVHVGDCYILSDDAKVESTKQESGPIVGIDLGTTRSVVAYVNQDGRPETIANFEGDPTTPSAVLFDDGIVSVGADAIKAAALMPERVAMYVKREMGQSTYSRQFGDQSYAPEMIQSLILARLRQDAERHLGEAVTRAVVTVPAYFNEPKRRATMDAGMLAGLDVVAVINEPTAAAIAFNAQEFTSSASESAEDDKRTLMVYDLGGGTFDVSIVTLQGDRVDVVATLGNAMLGGLDWDKCMARWMDEQFSAKHGVRPSEQEDGQAFLMRECEEIKHALSVRKRVPVRVSFQGSALTLEATRDEFVEITAHLLDRTRFTIKKLLGDAKLTWPEIDKLILVGGATRMPQVSEMLLKETGVTPDQSISADQAVAHGAAVYAWSLNSEKQIESEASIRVTDVNAHNLGVLGVDKRTRRHCNHVMIPRNTPLPAKRMTRFETIQDNQPSVVVQVLEGGDASGKHSTRIGRGVIHDLPPHLPAGTPVDVVFRYDTNGLIDVTAKLPRTGQTMSLTIDRNAGISADEVDQMREIHLALGLSAEDEDSDFSF